MVNKDGPDSGCETGRLHGSCPVPIHGNGFRQNFGKEMDQGRVANDNPETILALTSRRGQTYRSQ